MWRRSLARHALRLAARFVGAKTCVECHAPQVERWRQSMHARAMETPTPDSVKAPFAGERFSQHGVTTTSPESGDRFVVRTDGPEGTLQDFDVSYTFGVEPLQQYLLPMSGGRYQALSISWDTRAVGRGRPTMVPPLPARAASAGDVQHWTSPSQNWNARCAECHSTNLRKGYDAGHNGYKTIWSDISVACESRHGAGSRHLAWARGRSSTGPLAANEDDGLVPLGLKDGAHVAVRCGDWHRALGSPSDVACRSGVVRALPRATRGTHRRLPRWPAAHGDAPAVAAGRRAVLCGRTDSGRGLRYGSFLQSRMYANGVTCSDCHDPHRPEIASNPDAVCQRATCRRSSRHRPTITMPPSTRRAMRVVPHAHADIHGRRCAARPQLPRPPAGSHGEDWHAERLHGLPRQSTGVVGRGAGSHWFGTARLSTPHYGEAIAAGRSAAVDAESRLIAVVTTLPSRRSSAPRRPLCWRDGWTRCPAP